jgi:hypothetical protein
MSTILNSSGIVFPDSTTQTTGSSQLIRISSNIPVFNMQYSGGNYTISNSTQTKMILDTNNFDSHSGVDTTNYQYTIPITGYYRINYGVSLNGYYGGNVYSLYGMIYFDMNLRVNGTDVEDGGSYYDPYSGSGSYGMADIAQSASTLLYLNSGQILSLYAQGNLYPYGYGSGIAVGTSFLSGHLVN